MQIQYLDSIEMALYGTENCHIERNPMNIYCNATGTSISHNLGEYPHEKASEMKRIFFDQHMKEDLGIKNLLDFTQEIIKMEHTENGVYLNVEELHLREKREKVKQKKANIEPVTEPDITLILSKPFANLGQALHVADINQGTILKHQQIGIHTAAEARLHTATK